MALQPFILINKQVLWSNVSWPWMITNKKRNFSYSILLCLLTSIPENRLRSKLFMLNELCICICESVHLSPRPLHMIVFWRPQWKFNSFSKETCCYTVHGGGWWLNLHLILEFQMHTQSSGTEICALLVGKLGIMCFYICFPSWWFFKF